MSNTVLLSAQITTLEALAEPLTKLRGELEILNREREDLTHRITQAERAHQQLDLIGLHVGLVLDGPPVPVEITISAEPAEVIGPAELEEAETEASPEPVQEDEPATITEAEQEDHRSEGADPDPESVPEVSEETGPVLTHAARILTYLEAHPGSGAVAIGTGVGLNAKRAGSVLSGMRLTGQVDHDES